MGRRKAIYFSTHSGTGVFFERAIVDIPLTPGRRPQWQPIDRGRAGELPRQQVPGWLGAVISLGFFPPTPKKKKLTLCHPLSFLRVFMVGRSHLSPYPPPPG